MTHARKVAVVTDSTSDISHELAAQLGITMVPLNLHFGDEVFKDQIDINTDQFMAKMATTDKLPTTSQPSVGAFEETFRTVAAAGAAEIVCPVISSRLSGTYQSAQIAAQNLAGDVRIEVVDSLSGSWGLGFQVLRAVDLANQGWDASRIATTLLNETQHYHVVFFVETLEHLHRGGRITKAAQIVGSALKLRPLLRVDEGKVVPFERTRTRGKAMQALVDYAREIELVEELAVIHNTTPDDAAKLAGMLATITPERDIRITQMGPVLDTHLGPGALGIVVKVMPSE